MGAAEVLHRGPRECRPAFTMPRKEFFVLNGSPCKNHGKNSKDVVINRIFQDFPSHFSRAKQRQLEVEMGATLGDEGANKWFVA